MAVFCQSYGLGKAYHSATRGSSTNITHVHSAIFLLSSGLKIGDEILLLNGKPASALRMDDMKAAFVTSALSLSISTLPELDPQASCSVPPRRSDWEQDATTDIFSQNQGEQCRSILSLSLVKQIKPSRRWTSNQPQ